MQTNNKKISGVLHSSVSATHYNLRRYYPAAQLSSLVEQFWFVDWRLGNEARHTQQNLPDPNLHLVFDNGVAKLIGPVSKAYTYPMQGSGSILGIKFAIGGLVNWLETPLTAYVDKEIAARTCFGPEVDQLTTLLKAANDDEESVNLMQRFLMRFNSPPHTQVLETANMFEALKNNADITTVASLSRHSGISVRTLQRNFQTYIGVSPKWLIRKYRLHEALAELENLQTTLAELAAKLDYSDQSHLVRDFKKMLGITPSAYINP